MSRLGRLAVLVALWACGTAGGGAGGGGARPPLSSQREERLLTPAFNVIPGVAASRQNVFVPPPDGIGVLDRDFGRWLPPVTAADGYRGGVVTAIAADPLENAVWVALPGLLVYYRSLFDNLITAVVPGDIGDIFFDARNPSAGAYLRS